ncbi:MAG: cyclic nucleotide-binding domain-containing protein, partial [Gammaproteobacteria bacterium]|nr:cyclic nucleotide-binding domain-containing protein [Gammaproteobacteria bacterium]
MINTDSMPLLQGLSDAELNEILLYSKSRSYQKNTIIINEGDDTDSLYIIDTGGVKVYLSDDNGKEVVINTLQAGEYFGELAILIPGKRSASVVTTENASFKVIHKNDFKELLLNNPCIAYTLLENLARRVRDLTDNVKSLAL